MRRREWVLWVGALAGAIPACADDPVVFHSEVSLVRVDLQVVDRDNRSITGLGPRDFLLYEGGRQQKIQSVDTENLPIDLVLLLDVSASMRPHIERIAAASHEAMRRKGRGPAKSGRSTSSWRTRRAAVIREPRFTTAGPILPRPRRSVGPAALPSRWW